MFVADSKNEHKTKIEDGTAFLQDASGECAFGKKKRKKSLKLQSPTTTRGTQRTPTVVQASDHRQRVCNEQCYQVTQKLSMCYIMD